MRTYNVIVTRDAHDDLATIRDYVVRESGSRESARTTLQSIRKTVASLKTMPARTRTIDEEPWHTRGVRRILSGSYFVYYRIDEDAGIVYVLNVLNARGIKLVHQTSTRDEKRPNV